MFHMKTRAGYILFHQSVYKVFISNKKLNQKIHNVVTAVSHVRNYCTVNYYNTLRLVYESVFPRDSPVITHSTLLILLPYILWNYNQLPRANSRHKSNQHQGL